MSIDSKQVILGVSNSERRDCYLWFMAGTIEVWLDCIDWIELLKLGRN